MSNEYKLNDIKEDTVMLAVILNPVDGKDSMKVQISPMQNVADLWQALAYLMESVGVTAASMSQQDNPKGITGYEDMANYVSEYITKVIMNAEPKRGKHGN